METWATFSIIDHRKPVYRQALALFDRIVVPIPPHPIGDQTPQELDQLSAEVKFLAERGAAVLSDWNSSTFDEWRRPFLAAAISAKVNRDAFGDTRTMLAEQFNSKDVLAVPVYGGQEQYSQSKDAFGGVEQALTVEIMQRLPVPDFDTPLESLIRLREGAAFQTALDDLLEWKREQVPAILLAPDRGVAVAASMRTFDKLTKRYAETMEAAGFKKQGSVASIFFAIITGEPFAAIKEALVSFKEVREPCWKKMSDMKCAPGGVVYHFKEALGASQ